MIGSVPKYRIPNLGIQPLSERIWINLNKFHYNTAINNADGNLSCSIRQLYVSTEVDSVSDILFRRKSYYL